MIRGKGDKEMPVISVSKQVKEILDRIKEVEGHTSLDSVIRERLVRTGDIDGKEVK